MPSKRDIERELYQAEAKAESLQTLLTSALADREELQSQIIRLQDALVAASAPEAYRDQQIEKEEAARTPREQEDIDRARITHETTEGYLNSLERPLSTDDLDSWLARGLMRTSDGPASIHGNDES